MATDLPSADLAGVCEDFWHALIRDSPRFGVYRGYDVYPTLLDHYDRGRYEDRKNSCKELLTRAKAINVIDLSRKDNLSRDILLTYLHTCIRGLKFPVQYFAVSNFEGPHKETGKYMIQIMKVKTRQDYENYKTRIKSFPMQIEEIITCMRQGAQEGYAFPLDCVACIPEQIDFAVRLPPEVSEFYREPPQHLEEHIRIYLSSDVPSLIQECIYLPLLRMKLFYTQEYFPCCAQGLSMYNLPNGETMYRAQLQFHCDTGLSPEKMHEVGLREVQRLQQHMHEVIENVGFNGTIREFSNSLLSREEFKFSSHDELFSHCQELINSHIVPAIQHMFPEVPNVPLKMKVDPYPGFPALALHHAPSDSDPCGTLYFTSNLDAVRKYSLLTLMLHEALPGHHYQSSFSFHEDLPKFRKYKNDLVYGDVPGRTPMNTAYTEGWGLYCESLGQELGLFTDPYDQFGFHDQNLRRAVRIVVDTGIHAFKWSREEALAYMLENSAICEASAQAEITRYAIVPGQACSYTYGCLRIKALRQKAEHELGDLFDIREFHGECLRHGQIPLNILENLIEQYIADKKM